MSQSYDDKNSEDYSKYTELIHAAIDNIAKKMNLPPSIAQVSKMTGIHRNTIASREWPASRLSDIKKERQGKKEKEKKASKPLDSVRVLEDKLDNASKELIYWFNKCEGLVSSYEQLSKNSTLMIQAKDTYQEKYESEAKKVIELKVKIKHLEDLISIMGDEK